jgi:hypothetical protein
VIPLVAEVTGLAPPVEASRKAFRRRGFCRVTQRMGSSWPGDPISFPPSVTECYVSILILTSTDRELLQSIVEQHIDGLVVARDIVIQELDTENMLEAVATVDEAIVKTGNLLKRVQHAI